MQCDLVPTYSPRACTEKVLGRGDVMLTVGYHKGLKLSKNLGHASDIVIKLMAMSGKRSGPISQCA